MQKPIKVGSRCRIIGRHEETDDPCVYLAVIGEGPNVGIEVTVIQQLKPSQSLGRVWKVDAGSPRIVLYWGSVIQEADFAECLLEVIEEPPLAAVKRETAELIS